MFLVPLILLASILHAGPEHAVAPPVPESPYSQWLGGLATDGNVALAVWQDMGAVRAVRIDRDGRRLDERPLLLAPSGWPPVVVRGDGNWLVASASFTGGVSWRVVEDDGTVGEESDLAVAATIDGIDAAFDGTHFLVGWSGHEGIGAVRLDARGAVVEDSIFIPARGFFSSLNVVAFERGGFAIVAVQSVPSTGEYTVEAYRLDTNADLQSLGWLDTTNVSAITWLRVLADGDQLVAAWSGFDLGLFVAREGEPLRIVARGPIPQDILEIGGSVYVLAVNLGDSTVTLVSEDGTRRRTVGTNAEAALAASFGDRAVVGITARVGGAMDLSAGVVDATLQDVAPQQRLTFEPALQEMPAIARNAFGEALVVWAESGLADGGAVMAARVDAAGRPEGPPFRLAGFYHPPSAPRVVSDGTDFMVTWHEWDDIGVRAQRVLRDGTLQAAVSIPETFAGTCLAWNGTEYLVGHLRLRAATRNRMDMDIRATRLSRDGVLGETFVVAPEVTSFYSFNCAGGDDATLFTWTRLGNVEAALVDDNGTVSGKIHVAATHTFFPLDSVPFPAVTANGNTFLIGWNHEDRSLRWATLNEHGTVNASSEQFPLGGVDPGGTPVAAAPFRDGFLLAFGTRDLHALALDRNGHSLGDVSIAGTSAIERAPALAGGNSALAAYLRNTGTTEGAPYWRVFTRMVDDAGPRRRAVRQ
jgi:hypothetical protein